jgi:hypothetical protein
LPEPSNEEFLQVNDPGSQEPDLAGTAGDDNFTLRASTNGEMLLIYDAIPPAPGSAPVFSWPMNVAAPLTIETLAGDDVLAIELTDGTDGPVGGILFDGGSGANQVLHKSGRLQLDAFATGGSLSIAVSGAAELNTAGFDQVALSLAEEGTRVTILPGRDQASLLTSLIVGDGATLDITDNALVIDYTVDSPITDIRELILSGRGGSGFGASWNGTGITSSTAAAANTTEPESRSVAYAENALLPLGAYSSFRGRAVDDTAILIAYTRTADATLDGIVNDDDVTIVGATYAPAEPKAQWSLGDFDFNGFVDDDDVTLLGAFYDRSAAPLAAPLLTPRVASFVIAPGPNDRQHTTSDEGMWRVFDLWTEAVAAESSRQSLKIDDPRLAIARAIGEVLALWPD